VADAIPQGHPSPKADRRHEGSDIKYRNLLWIALAMLALAFTIHVALWYQMLLFRATPQKPGVAVSPLALSPQVPPPPRLQGNPADDLAQFRSAQNTLLNSYGWVDRKTGAVHIPIDRAMDLYLRENGVNPNSPAPVLSQPERPGPPTLTPHAPLTP